MIYQTAHRFLDDFRILSVLTVDPAASRVSYGLRYRTATGYGTDGYGADKSCDYWQRCSGIFTHVVEILDFRLRYQSVSKNTKIREFEVIYALKR